MSLIKRPPIPKPALREEPKQPLHLRHRPQTLNDVIGQEAAVKSIARLFEGKGAALPHAFLFTGPSGTGKTTLARIIGRMLQCDKHSIYEFDAARFGSAESVRELISGARFLGLGAANSHKIYVIDECHALSKAAWQTLLLVLEESPPHVWWALCTTEPEKVPQTVRTRCHAYDLKPVAWERIADFLGGISRNEGIQCPEGILDIIARRCNGSVRQALVYMSTVAGSTDKAEAMKLIEAVDSEEGSAFQLARMICLGRGFTWEAARAQLAALADENPEGVRLVIVNYAAKMLLDTKETKNAERLCAVLAAFGGPYNQSERQAPLLLAVGSLLFGG